MRRPSDKAVSESIDFRYYYEPTYDINVNRKRPRIRSSIADIPTVISEPYNAGFISGRNTYQTESTNNDLFLNDENMENLADLENLISDGKSNRSKFKLNISN